MKKAIAVWMVAAAMMTAALSVGAQEKEGINFNPFTYTCQELLNDMRAEEGGDNVGVALIWLHGYTIALLEPKQSEKLGPLTDKGLEVMTAFLMFYAQQNPEKTFIDAANAYVLQMMQ